jgi:hypothetical protein
MPLVRDANLVAAFRRLRKSRRSAGNSKLAATAAVDLTGPGARNDADTHSGRGRVPFGPGEKYRSMPSPSQQQSLRPPISPT